MKGLLFGILCLAILGCGSHQQPINYGKIDAQFDRSDQMNVSVIWTNDIEEVCWSGVDACTYWGGPDDMCEIYMPPFDWRDGYWWDNIYKCWLIGHEFLHCIFGDWHG